MLKWARWARTHPGTAVDVSATLPNIPPPSSASILSPATTSDQSIDPRTSRSVGALWSGPGQLLEWVIVISSCLDELGLIQAERLRTGVRGTADYSHQRQICETIRGLLGFSNRIVLSLLLWGKICRAAARKTVDVCGCVSVGTYPKKLQKKTHMMETDQSHTLGA